MIRPKHLSAACSAAAVIVALAAPTAQARPLGLGPGGAPLAVTTPATAPVAAQPTGSSGFDWIDAGIGAAVTVGAIGVAGAAGLRVRSHHHPATA